MKNILGLLYGGLIALSYLTIKLITQDEYLLYFVSACGVLAIGTLPFLKREIPKPFGGILLRGAMYAITNFMILASQNKGTVSSSLSAVLIGSMCVSLPGVLSPPYRKKNFLIVGCLLLGIAFLFDQILVSYLALISGAIQAITFASASKVMRTHQTPISWNLFVGFSTVAIFGAAFSVLTPIGDLRSVEITRLLGMCVVLCISQLAFFQLYRSHPAESAARYSLGRVPWAYLIDMIYTGKVFGLNVILGAILLSVGSFAKKERRAAAR